MAEIVVVRYTDPSVWGELVVVPVPPKTGAGRWKTVIVQLDGAGLAIMDRQVFDQELSVAAGLGLCRPWVVTQQFIETPPAQSINADADMRVESRKPAALLRGNGSTRISVANIYEMGKESKATRRSGSTDMPATWRA